MNDRPTVKIRLNPFSRGEITIDDGPPLPVRELSFESGVKMATIVRFTLIGVNIDAELPVDEIVDKLPMCRRCGSRVLGRLSVKHPCIPFRHGYRKGEPRMMLPLVP